jgi:tripartite ATP-independent transporter DctM subunit
MDILLIFGLLLLLMVIGVPIVGSLGLTAITVMFAMGGPGLLIMFAQRVYSPILSFPLLAVPFFILAGNLMNAGGMTLRIFEVAQLIVGRIQGGLGHVNVMASMLFAGMSGSAVADAAGLGLVEIHAMKRAGYGSSFAATITAVSSTIGPILPPSIPFVIYGSLAQVSIGTLFLAGIVPGLLMGLVLMVVVSLVAKKRDLPLSDERPPLRDALRIGARAAPALIMPFIIIGGILGGFATPTEAAVIASIYALLVGTLLYRDLRWADVPAIMWDSGKQTAQVLFIVAAAGAFGWVLVQQQVPNAIINGILGLTESPWVVLLLVNLILLVLGMFIEGLAIIIIAYPIFLPLMTAIGVDPAHFGVVMVLNVMIGLVTPPVGLCLYIVSEISGAPVSQILREIWPYLIALLVVLALVTYVPAISLFVPRAFGF